MYIYNYEVSSGKLTRICMRQCVGGPYALQAVCVRPSSYKRCLSRRRLHGEATCVGKRRLVWH